VEDVIAEGDKVVARCTVRATHTGEGLGFTASLKPIEITGVSISRIENGKIVEGWNHFDFMTLFQQIGAL
jgi:predicted ester cyclase